MTPDTDTPPSDSAEAEQPAGAGCAPTAGSAGLKKLAESVAAINAAGLEIDEYGLVVMPDDEHERFCQWLAGEPSNTTGPDDDSPFLFAISETDHRRMTDDLAPLTSTKVAAYMEAKSSGASHKEAMVASRHNDQALPEAGRSTP
jgi:hypothetical protein